MRNSSEAQVIHQRTNMSFLKLQPFGSEGSYLFIIKSKGYTVQLGLFHGGYMM